MDKKYFEEFDRYCMQEALAEARLAYAMEEVPVGAVLAKDGKIITRAHNLVETTQDGTAHAEILCLRAASKLFQDFRLTGTTLYVTLEPCSMCAGAAILSRVEKIIWGAKDPRHGAAGSWVNLFDKEHPIHSVKTMSGLLEEESKRLIQQFFKERRACKILKPSLRS
jgi:tRNA(adenine34) deaminase